MTTKIIKSEDPMDVAGVVDPTIPKKTKNENVLEGMKCPNCGSLEPFRIEVSTVLRFTDEGEDFLNDKGADQEWQDDSYCECVECDFAGKVADFKTE